MLRKWSEKHKQGGCGVTRKVWRLAYVDDEKGMQEMMGSLGRCTETKKLEMNVEKTKLMIFGKKVRMSRTKWDC